MQKLDFSGLACPMPVIKLKKFLAQNPDLIDAFEMSVSDQGALRDIPAFCAQQNLHCVLKEQAGSVIRFEIQRQTI
ncbi:sulfurtransferase TusA family protein [Thiomicrorhabdus sp. zzn3]|uniref:sulfurtransferase TusA family protein n=1 Tax=Thiomicrorhabdus sp. zzn3 TaxID=3039775 RepID=UPI002437229F|nr:sulfurtransferase TusA family protein [Thiomicrorhabdus sp. zzn3]MDG6778462.1 sulfurtransferase TusA family protein [Thiomicrorhabdus sp. zzn3]